MSGIHEAIVFSETHTEFEVYDRLPVLDERIKLRWVVPGQEGAMEFGPPGSTCRRVWVRPVNSTNVRIEGAGHLVCLCFVCVAGVLILFSFGFCRYRRRNLSCLVGFLFLFLLFAADGGLPVVGFFCSGRPL